MLKIQPLTPERIAQMAAGEVIDSLAAALRELLENALDAQASRIQVELWLQRWQIRVGDNGEGIPASELEQVARRHTSSKLSHPSLGFRGEALHSLAQLGSLTIQTRHGVDPHGWRATYNRDGELLHQQPAATALGTVVTVTNLFGEWPLRRQELPQTRPILTLLQNVALAHPAVSWQVHQDRRLLLSLWPGKTLQDILLQLLPQLDPSDLRYLSIQQQEADWEILLGLPDRLHRPRPDWIRLAVNGRFVQFPELQRVIQSVFHHTLPRHRHPLAVVHLRLPPEQVDWNRHPAKSELYVHELATRQEQLRHYLHSLLSPGSGQASRRSVHLIRASEAKQTYRISPNPAQNPSTQPALTGSLPPLKALAQLHHIYILTEHPQGLWLVEQHLAHERVRYEQLQQHWQLVEPNFPLTLEGLSPQALQQLEHLGLEPEPFGPHIHVLRRIPLALLQEDPQGIQGSLLELSRCEDLPSAQVAVACRGALRNGIPLTLEQMQRLLDAWQRTLNPHTCPHGRPVYLALAETDLARYFRRRWSICDRPGAGQGAGSLLELDSLGDRFATQVRQTTDASALRPKDGIKPSPL
ncbi:DNA mismatch repair endonuclease MutL [Synechococcus sp. Nb3U1]|uniref:DNA mismatch repair endonuclease MutL n=1 Tax=Synechococcus sp. Nb3U1 TaxID=1914529 RepID=UPI001F2D54E9|nr:DNA mismatch repair endonuclease MutL [Synechococcus sp. Nb3U1]MCF2972180.1 DNA mismatch repair endonuclease MutL [Synechococcus sp. Nb3U1]